jgi:hypothetical protein
MIDKKGTKFGNVGSTLTLKCKFCDHVHKSSHVVKDSAAAEISNSVITHMTLEHPDIWAELQQVVLLNQMRVTSLLINANALDLDHPHSISPLKQWYNNELIGMENGLIVSLNWQEDSETEDDDTQDDNLSISDNPPVVC